MSQSTAAIYTAHNRRISFGEQRKPFAQIASANAVTAIGLLHLHNPLVVRSANESLNLANSELRLQSLKKYLEMVFTTELDNLPGQVSLVEKPFDVYINADKQHHEAFSAMGISISNLVKTNGRPFFAFASVIMT